MLNLNGLAASNGLYPASPTVDHDIGDMLPWGTFPFLVGEVHRYDWLVHVGSDK